ncbi:MAG: undecaprenyl-phosphate glucose phosphotransferase [Phycisphaerae bacterium]|jgi:Undecaprenyl-phosphate glucose phosphotransferase
MLKQHNQFMLSLLMIADACAVATAWILSYWLRFTFLYVDPGKGVPELARLYLPVLPLIVVAHIFIFYRMRLYRPRRSDRLFGETRDILKAFVAAVIVVILIDYALPHSSKISRRFIATYAVVGTLCFATFRLAVRLSLRALRRRGYNRRTAVIVGSGRTAQRLHAALERNAWTGTHVLAYIDDRSADAPGEIRGVPVIGPLSTLPVIVERQRIDTVYVALPNDAAGRVNEVLELLEHDMCDVRLVPEIDPGYAMRPNVSELDGVPILSLRQAPLYGSNALLKRAFDLVVGAFFLVVAAVPMVIIAALIRLSSPGPVLYRQRRMGLDGREFDIFKFRTMRADAESDGPVWSQRSDPRRTRIGRFLRRTSLDELPNLLNVIKGDMSLVGPRPERPEFIAQFRQEIPRYMLRHKMKAGMTGYAQIRGWRGETSLRKRIQHDVHYIKNWSLALDVRILLQTLLFGWFSRHEA